MTQSCGNCKHGKRDASGYAQGFIALGWFQDHARCEKLQAIGALSIVDRRPDTMPGQFCQLWEQAK